MKNFIKLPASIIGCELVGIMGSIFTRDTIPTWYVYINKPVFSPPNWIFGPVWTTLYCLMGISFYLIWSQGWHKKAVKNAGQTFLAQLALNFLWTPLFFGLKSPLLGLITIIALWILIVLTMKKFYPLSKTAFYLLIPYLLWVSFATILNGAIWWLN
jgi:benzodiazapine receptor